MNFYRPEIFSALGIYWRFPNASSIYFITLKQFLDIEIIHQAALSHGDGYLHFFVIFFQVHISYFEYQYIKRSEATFEGLLQFINKLKIGMKQVQT